MTFERADYDSLLERDLSQRRKEAAPMIARTLQAAVAAEHLTGTPEWDYFLSLVQARRDQLVSEREHHAQAALDGTSSAREGHLRDYHRASAGLEALDFVLTIPRKVIEEGQKARDAQRATEKTEKS